MSPCVKCGGGCRIEGKAVCCKRCEVKVEGKTRYESMYLWNCLNPRKHPDQRVKEEFFAQDEKEFEFLLSFVKGKSLLEIGSRYGESLKRQARKLPVGSRIVSLDLGQDPYSPYVDTQSYRTKACKELSEEYEVHMLTGDSHDPGIVETVRKLSPFDFIFIDGDHSLSGVTKDWTDYGPMGKTVAFHDINGNNEMRDFWRDIPGNKKDCINSTMGIGIVFK